MPKVSVIIPHKIDRQRIMTVDSLMEQAFNDFEIIIQNDVNKEGASAMRNQGASKAIGEYLFFCDDDIILEPSCLEKMVKALDSEPSIHLVYCNYDFTGWKKGIQYGEFWDPELLKKRNYISSMSMIRREIFNLLGGFDTSLSRFQDWDLWLRFAELENVKAFYIPEILFTAYFDGTGISERGKQDFFINSHIIREKHKNYMYDLSIIIPVHNQLEMTKQCLETVIQNTCGSFEIIVIDDFSSDGTDAWLAEQKGIRVIRNLRRLGHTISTNIGAKISNGDFLVLLNNDTLVPSEWNLKLSRILRNNMNICCVGPLTSSAASPQLIGDMYDKRMQYGPNDINDLDKMVTTKREKCAIPSKITGFCMMTTKMIWDFVGEFDEDIEAGGNEADWIIRAMDYGFIPAMYTGCYVHHYGNMSYKNMPDVKELWKKGNKKIVQKHGIDKVMKLEKNLYSDLVGK